MRYTWQRLSVSFLVLLTSVLTLQGQTQIPTSLVYQWAAVSGAGAAAAIQFSDASKRASNYTIDASVTGTAPSSCTFRVEGSSDNQTWFGLDTTAPATTSCATSYMEHITSKPVLYLRINVVSYTAGDGTTSVIFHYTGKP